MLNAMNTSKINKTGLIITGNGYSSSGYEQVAMYNEP